MLSLQPPRHIPTLPSTDLTALKSNFRFTSGSGLGWTSRHVRKVPRGKKKFLPMYASSHPATKLRP
jgi:hypothetical protein